MHAARLSASILTPEVIHLLQSHVAESKLVNLYRTKQEEFIDYLRTSHLRQTLLCMVAHGLQNAEDVLLLAMGLTSVLQGEITVGEYGKHLPISIFQLMNGCYLTTM